MSRGRGKCSDGVILEGVLDLLGVKIGEVKADDRNRNGDYFHRFFLGYRRLSLGV